MRPFLILSVLSLACFAQAQTASKNPADDDASLKSVEHQWVDAYYHGDTETLARFESDDFTVIANGEKQTKAEQIAAVKARGPAGNPQANVEEELRHYGDVALITGLSEGSNVHYTAVWVKTNGQWKVVHLHYSMGG